MGRKRADDIQKCLNCTKPPRACNTCYDHYVDRPMTKLETECVRLCKEGLTIAEVSEQLKISESTVSRIRGQFNVYGNQKTVLANEKIDNDELIRLTAEGLTLAEIAEHFGVGVDYISKRKAELGIQRKSYERKKKNAADSEHSD